MNYRYMGYIASFITGMAILILEIISFRLLAPHFGTSSYVIGIIINTILLALAVGYISGGYTVDRFPSHKLPYLIILGADIYLMIIFCIYPVLLQFLSKRSVIAGSFAAILLMFFVPAALLAFVPTYLIKLLIIEKKVGTASGRIFFISTLGSIVGGLLTTFVFIPNLGSRTTFLMTIVILLMITIIGLVKFNKRFSLCFLLLAVPFVFSQATSSEYIYQTESEYNIISIREEKGSLFLELNDNFGYQSQSLDQETKLSYSYYDYLLFPNLLIDANRTLILGNGAGTSMMQMSHFFDTEIDGVEIDSKLTEVGRAYFRLKLNEDKLTIFHEDARTFLIHNDKGYDVINIDVYAGSPYIPFQTATVEFFQLVNRSLNEGGIVAINIPGYSINTPFGDYYLNTVTRVFPNSYLSGHVLYAFKSDLDKDSIIQRIGGKKLPENLDYISRKVLSKLEKVDLKSSGNIFTDELAPVEKMTFEIIKR